uniref:Transmembrane protein 43 homolog n=1 Tax=Cacopsylla melanoneura TaxID=428564 RepID=A0A8D9DYC8_9HEMI
MTAINGNPGGKLKCENVQVTRKKPKRSCNCFHTYNKKNFPLKFKFNVKTVLGLFLGVLGIVTIYLNETHAIDLTIHYNKAINKVTEIDSNHFSSEHDGKLVYLHGRLQVDEPLTEPEYGISIQAVKLRQRVQMFQWVEEVKDFQHTYEGQWKHKIIDSTKFLRNETHRNPTSFPLESKMYLSEGVRVGEYYLSDEYKQEFKDFTQITSDERPENRNIKMHFGLYYHSGNVWKPDIGDVRVQFAYAGLHDDPVSVVGKLMEGRTVYPYYNMTSGYHIKYIHTGPKVSLEDLLHTGHSKNIWTIRLFRVLAIALLFLSAHWILQRHRDVIMYNVFVSVSCTSVVTSYIWYWYYPAFSGELLLAAILSPLILTLLLGRQKLGYMKLATTSTDEK